MKTIKYVFWSIVCLFLTYCICFCPIKGNYKIKWENTETGEMKITYSSLIPFVKIDTIVKAPRPLLAEIIIHEKITVNGETKYNTVVKVGTEIYKYKDKDAYEYVNQFKDSTNHYKLEEIFYPFHYIRSYSYQIGQD